MSNRRSNAPPPPSFTTPAVEQPMTPQQRFEMPLPGETLVEQVRRITKHSREIESGGVRARHGDFRFTHTRGMVLRGYNAEDWRQTGRKAKSKSDRTSAADRRAATKKDLR
jgi:hypothetical protein